MWREFFHFLLAIFCHWLVTPGKAYIDDGSYGSYGSYGTGINRQYQQGANVYGPSNNEYGGPGTVEDHPPLYGPPAPPNTYYQPQYYQQPYQTPEPQTPPPDTLPPTPPPTTTMATPPPPPETTTIPTMPTTITFPTEPPPTPPPTPAPTPPPVNPSYYGRSYGGLVPGGPSGNGQMMKARFEGWLSYPAPAPAPAPAPSPSYGQPPPLTPQTYGAPNGGSYGGGGSFGGNEVKASTYGM